MKYQELLLLVRSEAAAFLNKESEAEWSTLEQMLLPLVHSHHRQVTQTLWALTSLSTEGANNMQLTVLFQGSKEAIYTESHTETATLKGSIICFLSCSSLQITLCAKASPGPQGEGWGAKCKQPWSFLMTFESIVSPCSKCYICLFVCLVLFPLPLRPTQNGICKEFR